MVDSYPKEWKIVRREDMPDEVSEACHIKARFVRYYKTDEEWWPIVSLSVDMKDFTEGKALGPGATLNCLWVGDRSKLWMHTPIPPRLVAEAAEMLKSAATFPLLSDSIKPERPFTPMVVKILKHADYISHKRGMDYVDTIHLLIGLLYANESQAMQIIVNQEGLPGKMQEMAEEWMGYNEGERPPKSDELETW